MKPVSEIVSGHDGDARWRPVRSWGDELGGGRLKVTGIFGGRAESFHDESGDEWVRATV